MTWLSVILGVGALGSPISLLILLATRKRKIEGEIGLDKAQESEVINRAAAINQTRELERDRFWQEKLDATEARCNKQVDKLKEEVDVMEAFIDHTVPWIWGAVRNMKLRDIDYTDPPSLSDIRRQLRELRDRG